MKTINKQQLVTLMLLVIPAITVPIVTMTTQNANARLFDQPICDIPRQCTNSQGYNDGRAAAHRDFLSGTNSGNIACPRLWSNDYCSGYRDGYSTEMSNNSNR